MDISIKMLTVIDVLRITNHLLCLITQKSTASQKIITICGFIVVNAKHIPASQSFLYETEKYKNPVIPRRTRGVICPFSRTDIVGAKMKAADNASQRCF
jgi:hypothetical protein